MQPESILKRYFGHSSFRGRQLEIIEHVISKKHALVIMPTGMGKSLCFQIPALINAADSRKSENESSLNRRNLTLVISPLIALMKDHVDGLLRRGIDATFVNSSLTSDLRKKRYQQIGQGDFDLLYVTPERFRKSEFLDVMKNRNINLLAVDEAHCISEWGHDFRPDYTRLKQIRETIGNPTTIALTATATPDVQDDIVKQLGISKNDIQLFHQGIDRPNLTLEMKEVWGDDEKVDAIVQTIQKVGGSGIIYFTLIRVLMDFSEKLRKLGVKHLVYHGELPSHERKTIQERFMNNPDQIVLATNAFGMGIDKEDIRFVLHADIPGSMESYYQEIGRAGRDGLDSQCLLLYDEADLTTQMEFIQWSNPNAEFYERVYDFLLHDLEKVNAFGLEWLREKLHHKKKHDRRLETVLSMLDRYGIIEGSLEPLKVKLVAELHSNLCDQERLDAKLQRDQQKLYALVQYVRHTGDRKAFIHEYFGLPYVSDEKKIGSR